MLENVKRAAPGWLGLSPDRRSFIYISERAEIVKQIFELNISGFGGLAIAQFLNTKRTPGFGSAAIWDQSTIHNILTNRATFGEYQKQRKANGGKQLIGDPIANYYPPVITRSTFEAAQSARRRNIEVRSGRRGAEITNLFFGIHLECFYCEKAIKFLSKSHENRLVCTAVVSGSSACPRFAWTYRDFEATFFNSVYDANHCPNFTNMIDSLRAANTSGGRSDRLQIRMHIAGWLTSLVSKVTLASAGSEPPPPKQHLLVRRDHPARFFIAQFRDKFSVRGLPEKCEPTGAKLDPTTIEKIFSLSPRQSEITSLLAQGFTLHQTAEKLSQTLETARWHLREIFRRTNTHSQMELIELAKQVCAD